MFRWCVVLLSVVSVLAPLPPPAHALGSHAAVLTHRQPLRLANDPSKPLFVVGISGGLTGARMVASVFADGRVLTVRDRGPRPSSTIETHVPVSRGAIQAVLEIAVRHHVFGIPRSVQDRVFGADIPLLSLKIATPNGVRSVHVMGMEQAHPAGTRAFFPVWSLLYALAGYPPQVM